MTLYEYREGIEIATKDPSFYALIQAAMRRADTKNLEMLKGCWPEVYEELLKRYNAPRGELAEDLIGNKEQK